MAERDLTFTLSMRCESAAFEDDPTREIARLLHEVAEKVRQVASQDGRSAEGVLYDVNGANVGTFKLAAEGPACGVTVDVWRGDDGAAVVQIDTEFEPDDPDEGLRINVNEAFVYGKRRVPR